MKNQVVIATLGLVLAGGACTSTQSQSVVMVSVSADADMPAATQLRANLTGAGVLAVEYFPQVNSPTPISFTPTATFALVIPRSHSGDLRVLIDALDVASQAVGQGEGTVRIEVGTRADVAIVLHRIQPGIGGAGGNGATGGNTSPRTSSPLATGGTVVVGAGGTGAPGGRVDTGGTQGSGGAGGAGGRATTGGAPGSGGAAAPGGRIDTGGAPGSGGTAAPGGHIDTSGAPGSGGAAAPGGRIDTGGAPGSGGTAAPGGRIDTGGAPGSGGTVVSGGSTNTGGRASTGTTSSGGSTGTAGASAAGGSTGGTSSTVPPSNVVPSPGCSATPTKTSLCTHTALDACTIEVKGITREYYLNLPPGYDGKKPVPVVWQYHPLGGNAKATMAMYGLNTNLQNVIFVSPQGLGSPTGFANTAGQDEDMTRAINAEIESKYCIDTSRYFATGFNYGGAMAFTAACNMSDIFRAVGAMSGSTVSGATCSTKKPARMVAVWATHGEDDDTLPISTATLMIQALAKYNGCSTTTAVVDPSPCVAYQGCQPGYPVVWCPRPGEKHDIPTFAATAIAKFFQQFF